MNVNRKRRIMTKLANLAPLGLNVYNPAAKKLKTNTRKLLSQPLPWDKFRLGSWTWKEAIKP